MTKYLAFLVCLILGCQVRPALHLAKVEASDYSNLDLWAAHPFKLDSADLIPDSSFMDKQDLAGVDVFFLHPTTYTGQKGHKYWNAPMLDPELIEKTDATTIRHQASIFNGVGKVFAPRYRQAHLHAYFTKNKQDARKAFDLAYVDVRAAFLQYLNSWNQGRPIIIASHSQGSTHAIRLMEEFFDGKELQGKLVVAYLVGMPVTAGKFDQIPLCQTPTDVECYCSWRTFKSGHTPKKHLTGDSIAVTNPLTWQTSPTYADHLLNQGGVLRNFHGGTWPNLTDARINNGILWARKPKFPGSFLMLFKNYHVADYNLYWVNVRLNAQQRWQAYQDVLEESEN